MLADESASVRRWLSTAGLSDDEIEDLYDKSHQVLCKS